MVCVISNGIGKKIYVPIIYLFDGERPHNGEIDLTILICSGGVHFYKNNVMKNIKKRDTPNSIL